VTKEFQMTNNGCSRFMYNVHSPIRQLDVF